MEVADSRAELLARQLDVLAPCAMGGTLDDGTVAVLTARIVCGGANNQLAHPGIEKMLADRGILYAPDYLVNAGGVIQVADELAGFNFQRAQARAARIFTTTRKIFALADEEGVPPAVAADRLAERRMAEIGPAARYLARLLTGCQAAPARHAPGEGSARGAKQVPLEGYAGSNARRAPGGGVTARLRAVTHARCGRRAASRS